MLGRDKIIRTCNSSILNTIVSSDAQKEDKNEIVEEKSDVSSSMLRVGECKKRTDYLSWPDYFMAVAFLAAQRSKDPNSQVGACIVNSENKIVGVGYNGMPNGCDDDLLPWDRVGDKLDTKYPYVCHAEMNSIMNKNSAEVKNCTMYVALFPCNECAKLCIQAGIKEIIYMSDKYKDTPETTASKKLLTMAGVKYTQFHPQQPQIVINFASINSS